MNCCCSYILDLCNVNVCGTIRTGVMAPIDGIYTLVLDFLGAELKIFLTTFAEEELIFPATALNENYTFTGYIIDPNGERMAVVKDEVSYDCISFKTQFSYELNTIE